MKDSSGTKNPWSSLMHQMFSAGERSGLQAVNLTTKTCLLQTQAVIIAAECSLILSCWNIQGLLWKKMLSGWNVCCFKICTYLSTLIDPFYLCKLPVLSALIHFLNNRDAGFKHWVQPASWMFPPLCSAASIFFQIFEVILRDFFLYLNANVYFAMILMKATSRNALVS